MHRERHLRISTVIVNYNTRDILKECLMNLRKSYERTQVLVVDNNSQDGSRELIMENFPEVELLALNKNVGLAAGNNRGLDKARNDYVLFMGSDAFPHKKALSALVDYMDKNPETGICTGDVRLRTGAIDKDTHRGFPTPWVALTHFSGLGRLFPNSRLFNGYHLGYLDMNTPHEIDLCTSHFMFTRKKIFDQIGKWDENFFVYGEDVDLCWRVKQGGWKIMYIPEAKIVHYKGVSVGIRTETQDVTKATADTRKKMLLETTEAMGKFYKKHYGDKKYSRIIEVGINMLAKYRLTKLSRYD